MTQCADCPWRDVDALREGEPFMQKAVAHAEAGHLDGWVCHTRCVPCPGPRIAARRKLLEVSA